MVKYLKLFEKAEEIAVFRGLDTSNINIRETIAELIVYAVSFRSNGTDIKTDEIDRELLMETRLYVNEGIESLRTHE